jgi:hypothetical protein
MAVPAIMSLHTRGALGVARHVRLLFMDFYASEQ